MIQTISYQEISGKIDTSSSVWGSSAKIFDIIPENGTANRVYKNYLRPIHIERITSRGITYLQHLTNLSMIRSEELIVPKIAVTNPIAIVGNLMKKAPGNLLMEQSVSIEAIASTKNNIRKSILDISSSFEIFDLNSGSIFYNSKQGLTLVDLESYMEEKGNHAHVNLFRFYSKVIDVLHYVPELQERICSELQKSIDACRIEVIYDIVQAYLKEKEITEEKAKVYIKK